MPGNAITGEEHGLIYYLSKDLQEAEMVKLIVSFLMEQGAELLVNDLKTLAAKGVPIRILTGRYLNITEPSAVYLLKKELGDSLDIRFFNRQNVSFHPKAYIIEKKKGGVIYIGSSNLSRSALTNGVEWNFRLEEQVAPEDYAQFVAAFDRLFERQSEKVTDEVLMEYAANWRRTIFSEDRPQTEEIVRPRGAQIEALYNLAECRRNGYKKGLVVAATGIGKTYLAAFDSKKYARVLFLAHKEEILRQAEASFAKVRPGAKTGFFSGQEKTLDAELLFATVQTLGQERYLKPEVFSPDYFDYIVVDEFHHAAADSYLRVLNYFRPKFLLGLTATPYRMDNRDIFALCDNNVVYEIYLADAINRGLLVPFRYYAFYDDTDYDRIAFRNGHYDIKQLEAALSQNRRAGLVLEKYKMFQKEKAIGFCAGIRHAEYMAEYFNQHKVPAAVVHSGPSESRYYLSRQEAISQLVEGKLKVIFTVDMFNEGVDIPTVDMVMFLRPTESYVVFLQQLGRGLRKAENKEYLTVLDFIGNYKRAHHIPYLLAGKNPMAVEGKKFRLPHEIDFPEGCIVNFDFKLIDLFQELRKRDPLAQRLKDEFWRLQDELGRRPTRLDVYLGSDIPLRHFLNMDGWLGFLASIDQLTAEEQNWLNNNVAAFLRELEKTSMTKSYKIPTLLSFIENDRLLHSVNKSRLIQVWREYYSDPVHEQDMIRDKTTRTWRNWDDEKLARLAIRNPVFYLSQGRFFHFDEINQVFTLDSSIVEHISPLLAEHVRDILTWRSTEYFATRHRRGE